jgi:hypothetical protein
MELTTGRDRRGRRFIAVGKFIAYYSIMIVSLVWIANAFVTWSVSHLLELLVLLISPAFVSGFLIYESRRKPGTIHTWLLIGGAEFHLVFVTLVVVYELFHLDDVPQRSIEGIVCVVVVGSLMAAVAMYRWIKSRSRLLELQGDEATGSLRS